MIWLLRHGDAEEAAEDDAARRLTESGTRQAEVAGRALKALEAGVDTCLKETESLRGGNIDLQQVADQASAQGGQAGTVLLVGHEPDLSHGIEATTGARVKLRKGGLAAIEDGTLIALLTPTQLGAIAAPR
jgi:phosphohistidine phosphatase